MSARKGHDYKRQKNWENQKYLFSLSRWQRVHMYQDARWFPWYFNFNPSLNKIKKKERKIQCESHHIRFLLFDVTGRERWWSHYLSPFLNETYPSFSSEAVINLYQKQTHCFKQEKLGCDLLPQHNPNLAEWHNSQTQFTVLKSHWKN